MLGNAGRRIIWLLALQVLVGCGSKDPLAPQVGTIVVNAVPSSIRAPWRLTGPADFDHSGIGSSTLERLAPGTYTITWRGVSGWTTPSSPTVAQTLAANGNLDFTGTYVVRPGTITINPLPSGIDAPWVINGPNAFTQLGSGGWTLPNMPAGSYTVTWGAVAEWTAPSQTTDTQILVVDGSLTFTATYVAGNQAPNCNVSIEDLDFGSTPIFSEAIQSFTITNGGGGTLSGAIVLGGDAEGACGPFTITAGAGSFALEPGDTKTVTLAFRPATLGQSDACAVIFGNLGCEDVPLSGFGERRECLTPIGWVRTPGISWCVVVRDQIAYVADGSRGLQIIDVSSPESPRIVGAASTAGDAQCLALSNSYAFVVIRALGVGVYDISDSAQPTLVTTFNTSGNPFAICISGARAYVACATGQLQVLDIANPRSPLSLFTVTTTESWGIAVVGDHAYVADGSFGGLKIFDIRSADTARLVGQVATPSDASDVEVVNGFAYVADGNGVVQVDVRDPQNPEQRRVLEFGTQTFALDARGSRLVVADRELGVRMIDVSDPDEPTTIFTHATQGNAQWAYFDGPLTFVADGWAGLRVIYTDCLP